MGYRDYRAPGVSIIVERQPGVETASLNQFYPVFVGTGMTSRSRKIPYASVTADTSAFPEVTFTVNFSGLISNQMFADTDFTLSKFSIHKTIDPATTPITVLVAPTDYTNPGLITNIRTDGQVTFTVHIVNAAIVATDLVYDLEITATNTVDDFKPRLVQSADVYYAQDIVGPYKLVENGIHFLNDIAIAAEIAFRSKVSAFYYVEVPRDYGSPALPVDIASKLEEIYYKRSAYRITPLTSDPTVAAALRSLVTSISNPLDARETVGFVSYPSSGITSMKDIVELTTKVGGLSKSLNCPRISNVFGCQTVEMTIGGEVYALPEYFLQVGVVSLDASLGIADPLSRRELSVFSKLNGPRFRPKDWNTLAAERVFIVYQDDPSEPIIIRHQLTTSQSNAAEDQEYSLVKNIDAVTNLLRDRLSPYSGQFNITDGYMEKLDATFTSAVEEAKGMGIARDIILLAPWSLRVVPDPTGQQTEKRNLVTRYRLVPPYPANNLDVYLLI